MAEINERDNFFEGILYGFIAIIVYSLYLFYKDF
jgi:hypothetical protein